MKLDDVFKTRTMARILASQGQIRKAKSIYLYLLEQAPHREDLKMEMLLLDTKGPGCSQAVETDVGGGLDPVYAQWIDAAFSYFRKER